jgi:hypothetical protein
MVSRRSRHLGVSARTFGDNHYAHYYRCMQRLPTALVLISLALLCLPASGSGHSGGTDSAGGHYCWTNCAASSLAYGQYHFHGGSTYTPQVSEVASDGDAFNSGGFLYGGWRFQSPSGNLVCYWTDGSLLCSVNSGGRSVVLAPRGAAKVVRGTMGPDNAPVLNYGRAWFPNSAARWGCISKKTGIWCTNLSRHGFRVSRDQVKTW